MIHKAKDLSPEQKMAIESLLGRSIAEDEAISIRTLASASAPEWLRQSWETRKAGRAGSALYRRNRCRNRRRAEGTA
jgi:hypothetical protein